MFELLYYIYNYKRFEGVEIVRELRKVNKLYIIINIKLYYK